MLIVFIVIIPIIVIIVPFMMFMMPVFFIMLAMMLIMTVTIRAIMFMPAFAMITNPVIKWIIVHRPWFYCLSLPIYDSSHSGGNACNSHTPPAYACRKSLLFQEPNRHSPNYYHIFCIIIQ